MSLPYEKEKEQYTQEFYALAEKYGITARGGAHNGVMDAYRHAFVSGRFTDEHGAVIAKLAGDIHELRNPNDEAEKKMDLHNNALGRQVAAGTPGKDPEEFFKALMRNENRMILEVGNPNNVKYLGSAEQNNNGTQVASVDPQQTAIRNLQEQGLTVNQSTNGQGYVVSSGGEFGRNTPVSDISQYTNPDKAREFAQNMVPQPQQEQEQNRTRSMA